MDRRVDPVQIPEDDGMQTRSHCPCSIWQKEAQAL